MKEEHKCNEKASFRYTWAGQDERFICAKHAEYLSAVADAIGYYCQFVPVDDDFLRCQQIIDKKN